MVGRKLVERLGQEPECLGSGIDQLILADAFASPVPESLGAITKVLTLDFAAPGSAEKLIEQRPDLIFHLAAIVSGEAEADFDKGYTINLDGTRLLFEAIRQAG